MHAPAEQSGGSLAKATALAGTELEDGMGDREGLPLEPEWDEDDDNEPPDLREKVYSTNLNEFIISKCQRRAQHGCDVVRSGLSSTPLLEVKAKKEETESLLPRYRKLVVEEKAPSLPLRETGDVIQPRHIELSSKEAPSRTPSKIGSRADSKSSPKRAMTRDIVQFGAPFFFVEEQERQIEVDLIRMGDCTGTVSVKWKTEDGSAVAGVHYESATGSLTFQSGQKDGSIKVSIKESTVWNATLEFRIRIYDAVNCDLGLKFETCRVKIIDNDCFPTNKYADAIKQGEEGVRRINEAGLMFEFLKMQYRIRGVKWRTYLQLFFDQFKNLFLWFNLHIPMYFADVLFAPEPGTVEFIPGIRSGLLIEGSREQSAVALAVITVVPLIAIHAWDYYCVGMDLKGTLRNYLRASLFRKYLNYDEYARICVHHSEMQVAVNVDVCEVAASYLTMLELVRAFVRVLIILIFTARRNPQALWIIIVMPSVMFLWVRHRSRLYEQVCDREGELLLESSKFVTEGCMSYSIVAAYRQRPLMNDQFLKKLDDLSKRGRIPKEQVELNNKYFAKWLGPVFSSMYIVITAPDVTAKKISLGSFIATAAVFHSIASNFSDVYKELMTLSSVFGALQNLTVLFNHSTDTLSDKKASRASRSRMRQARRQAAMEHTGEAGNTLCEDRIPLRIEGMSFQYPGAADKLINSVNLVLPQGSLVALCGASETSGRNTFMQLLGSRIFPSEGSVFIPLHLRVVHVGAKPMLLNMSLTENLVFGDPSASLTRVRSIAEALGMVNTTRILNTHLDGDYGGSDPMEATWKDAFPETEVAKVHLARAFITSPEVLILHRPLLHFSPGAWSRQRLLELMRQHVRERGLAYSQDSYYRRRPRTCVFTPESEEEASVADVIWDLNNDGTVTVRGGSSPPGG